MNPATLPMFRPMVGHAACAVQHEGQGT